MLDPSFQIKRVETKEEANARAKERKRIERERNSEIEGIVNEHGTATPALICALMGVNPEPQTPHETTQKRIIYRRCQRLAEHGRFRVHSEYTILARHAKRNKSWKKHVRAGAIYYTSLLLPKKEEMQFEHNAGISHTRATLTRAFEFDTIRTNTQMREQKDELSQRMSHVFDFYGQKKPLAFAVEYSRSKPVEISNKCQEWEARSKRFLEYYSDITDYRYLWVVETETKARNIQQRWKEDGLTSGRLLVTWKDQFSPYRASSILEPIWLWPKDENFQSLRQNNGR
jgi:hypothetical protein